MSAGAVRIQTDTICVYKVPFLKVSQPGCWAYADMLQVANPPVRKRVFGAILSYKRIKLPVQQARDKRRK